MDDQEDLGLWLVVANEVAQYSIWFADRPLPMGWRAVGSEASKQECLRSIGDLWTDMRPVRARAPDRC
ncbi:MAG: MbtH family NRPS accessory protein [Actinomycetota bacterium]